VQLAAFYGLAADKAARATLMAWVVLQDLTIEERFPHGIV
jgi:hypothetical protein